jgi:phage-related protein
MWLVDLYERPNGRCPVQEFLDDLSPKNDLPFIQRKFGMLEELGYRLGRPHTAILRDDIYELRVETLNGQFRFFYFFFDGQKIILTHGIKKKSKKTPSGEIDKAIGYRKEYYSRIKESKK